MLGDGYLYSWGDNYDGQLGHGNYNNKSVPTKVNGISESIREIKCGHFHSMAITSNGNLYYWGEGDDERISEIQKIDILKASGNNEISFEKKFEDLICCWPQSHCKFSNQIQKAVEEIFLVLTSNSIAKDISIYLMKMLISYLLFKF
uniref:Uncharacterized protein n=1 Tax=Arcella intermedia TaxID=1963864 RepID=A0A6B2LHL4_9EUKA